jgi:hypothetical protein
VTRTGGLFGGVGLSLIAAVSELVSEVTVDASPEVVLCSLQVVHGSLPVLASG